MKRKITLSLLLMFVSLGLTAQSNNTTTMQKLINKDWLMTVSNPNDLSFKFRYTTTYLTEALTYQGKTTSDVSAFYLSNQIETTFDYSKVGNVTDGKYIISFIPERNGYSYFDVYEILVLTDVYMEIKSLKSYKTFKFNVQ
jgi:hypothetical protein